MRIVKNISIDEKLYDKAKKCAERLGLTFSAYISFLIANETGERK